MNFRWAPYRTSVTRLRAGSGSGTTTNPIYGRWLGQMSHSGDFARWPHLGPIRPMDGGGHLGPLSYVYGYRGGIGRRGVGQDTTGDDGIEIRAQVRRYQLIPWRCAAGFVPKSAIWTMGRCGSTEKRPLAYSTLGSRPGGAVVVVAGDTDGHSACSGAFGVVLLAFA